MRHRWLTGGERQSWDDWLRDVPDSNIRQTSIYARALELYGHRAEILLLERDDRPVAGALIGIRPTAPLIGPMVHVSGGIALADPGDPQPLGAFVDALLARCAELDACRVELVLRIPRRRGERSEPGAARIEQALAERRFEPTAPLSTYYVDLAASSEDALLARLGKNPRRHVRKAAREGLTVAPSPDPAVFEEFERVHREMCRRKGLVARPRGFAGEVLLPLARAGLGDLFVASFAGIPRNYLFTGSVGHPFYHWGAIADAARERGCPQTGQALHFAAMCYYRSRGKRCYDFGGAPGPEPDPSHPNFSVWKFKREFGGEFVDFVGFWGRSLRPGRTALLGGLRRWSSRLRRVGGRLTLTGRSKRS